jgi:hypothetical protein
MDLADIAQGDRGSGDRRLGNRALDSHVDAAELAVVSAFMLVLLGVVSDMASDCRSEGLRTTGVAGLWEGEPAACGGSVDRRQRAASRMDLSRAMRENRR